MSKRYSMVPDATSQSLYFDVEGNSLNDTPGEPVNSLVAANFTISYVRQGAAAVAVTLSDLASTSSAYSSGGIKFVSNGRYRLDIPNAAGASGVALYIVQVTVAAASNAQSAGIAVNIKVT